jgi:aspartyl-tRNA(Asn)/glutamyl-tRNA(Gln) amidotransferase subunit A
LVAHGSSLDQIGPLARSVEDAAILLGCVAGHDPLDSTSLDVPVPDYLREMKSGAGLKGMRVGVPREYFGGEGIEVGVEAAVRAALDLLVDLGAELIDISLPHTEYCIPIYYLIATAEASSNLARYDGVRYGLREDAPDMWGTYYDTRRGGFGPEVKRRIMLGTYALSAGYYDAYYLKAQQARTLLRLDFERAWEQVDLIASPTSPTVAFKMGQKVDDPLQMYLTDVFTVSLNLAGMCGISIPCGFSDGMPVGLQFMGPALGESVILRAAYAYEQATEWHKQRPSVS